MQHPSIIKKVSYKDLVEELWRTPISDDPEEGSVLKKTIANCNYGKLEKHVFIAALSFVRTDLCYGLAPACLAWRHPRLRRPG